MSIIVFFTIPLASHAYSLLLARALALARVFKLDFSSENRARARARTRARRKGGKTVALYSISVYYIP